MTRRTIILANGFLLAALLACGVVYLHSSRPGPAVRSDAAMNPEAGESLQDLSGSERQPLSEMEQSEPSMTLDQQQQASLGTQTGEQDADEEDVYYVVVSKPVAFLNPEPSLVINTNQRQAIIEVQENFRKAMSMAGTPSSPEYLDRWMAEQELADELLKAYLGPEDFSKFHESIR